VEPPARTEVEVPKPETAKREPAAIKPMVVKPMEAKPKETKPAGGAKPRETAPARAVKPRETAPVGTALPRETGPVVALKTPAERPRAADKEPVAPPLTAKPEKPEKEEIAAPPAAPPESDGNSERIRFDKKRFTWPVKGRVVSRFGIQPNRMYHNGIRIAAAEGAAVQAAADGLVIFSAPLKDYGETIIIQHDGQYATVYTRLGVRAVRAESRVRRGDRIAFLGKAENQEEPALDFEVRYKNKARNPLFFLP
jgi:lipoprotein NlpD